MSLLEIVKYPSPILRKVADPVSEIDAKVRKLLDDMLETMYAAAGIGLAAPQVGVSKQVIVIDLKDRFKPEDDASLSSTEVEPQESSRIYQLVNPVIVSKFGQAIGEEGCLSIPEIREKVERYQKITVEALNKEGEKVTIEADGLLAICLQHEIDHLNGILFIDRLTRIRKALVSNKLKKLV